MTIPPIPAPTQVKDDPKVLTGWAMYDWANSVYPLVITSSIFPIYWGVVAVDSEGRDAVEFLGFHLPGSVLLTYAISTAFLLIALLNPFLTSIADYSGRRKAFMQFFCYLGAASCCGLFFLTKETLTLSVFVFVLATVGFSGSIVFYNSYLPVIASEEQYDRVSARGFSMGYVGSVILLVLCLILITFHDTFGLEKSFATRLSFLLTGIWWVGFAQLPFARLPKDTGTSAAQETAAAGVAAGGPASGSVLLNGVRELAHVWAEVKHLPMLKRFLLAYFTYNMGVQTVMYVATIFGDKELHLESTALIITILLLQIVAIAGAIFFARLSERIGNTRALSVAVIIWAGICVAGYFVQAGWSFYALASVIGLTMGGVQSLSRSTYSKIIPENTPDTASYFAFFDITEKLSIVIGTLSFGYIAQVTGSMRNSILSLILFFIVGLGFLLTLRGKALRPGGAGLTVVEDAEYEEV